MHVQIHSRIFLDVISRFVVFCSFVFLYFMSLSSLWHFIILKVYFCQCYFLAVNFGLFLSLFILMSFLCYLSFLLVNFVQCLFLSTFTCCRFLFTLFLRYLSFSSFMSPFTCRFPCIFKILQKRLGFYIVFILKLCFVLFVVFKFIISLMTLCCFSLSCRFYSSLSSIYLLLCHFYSFLSSKYLLLCRFYVSVVFSVFCRLNLLVGFVFLSFLH